MGGAGEGLPVGVWAEGGGGFEGEVSGVRGPGDLDTGFCEGDGEEDVPWGERDGEWGKETACEGEGGTGGGGRIGLGNSPEEVKVAGGGEVTTAKDMAGELELAAGTALREWSWGECESEGDQK